MGFNSSQFQKEFVNFENGIIQIRQELQTLSSKLAKNENKGERNDEDEKIKVKLKSDMDTLLSFIFPETIRILSSISDGVSQFWKEDEVDDDDVVVKMEMEQEHDDRLLEAFQIKPDFLDNLDEHEEQIEIAAEDFDENISIDSLDPLSEDALKLECLTNLPDLRLCRVQNNPKRKKSLKPKVNKIGRKQKIKQNLVPQNEDAKAKQQICRNEIMMPSTSSVSDDNSPHNNQEDVNMTSYQLRRRISRKKIVTPVSDSNDDDDDEDDKIKSEPESTYSEDDESDFNLDEDEVSSKRSKIGLGRKSNTVQRKMTTDDNANYTCSACSDHFDRKYKFKRHCLIKHPQLYFSLFGPHPHLSQHVTTMEDWLKYVNVLEDGTVDEKYKFKCITCSRPVKLPHNALDHEETHLSSEEKKSHFSSQCNVCGKIISIRSLPDHVLRKHPETVPFEDRCKKCNKVFVSVSKLRTHERRALEGSIKCIPPEEEEKNNDKVACLECKKLFSSRTSLNAHMKLHRENLIQYKCSSPGCEKIFKSTKLLSVHFEGVHSGLEKYHCKIDGCSRRFRWERSLRVHMDTHKTEDEKLICSMCPRRFNSEWNLERHISAVHLQERRFPCSYNGCSKSFKTKPHLKYHLNTHVNPGGRQRGLNVVKEIIQDQ